MSRVSSSRVEKSVSGGAEGGSSTPSCKVKSASLSEWAAASIRADFPFTTRATRMRRCSQGNNCTSAMLTSSQLPRRKRDSKGVSTGRRDFRRRPSPKNYKFLQGRGGMLLRRAMLSRPQRVARRASPRDVNVEFRRDRRLLGEEFAQHRGRKLAAAAAAVSERCQAGGGSVHGKDPPNGDEEAAGGLGPSQSARPGAPAPHRQPGSPRRRNKPVACRVCLRSSHTRTGPHAEYPPPWRGSGRRFFQLPLR